MPKPPSNLGSASKNLGGLKEDPTSAVWVLPLFYGFSGFTRIFTNKIQKLITGPHLATGFVSVPMLHLCWFYEVTVGTL